MEHLRSLAMRLFFWMQGRDAERSRQQQAHERTMADGLQRQYVDPDTFIQRQQVLRQTQAPRPPATRPAALSLDAQLAALQARLEAEMQARQIREQQRRQQWGR